jgi:hypothetical protein
MRKIAAFERTPFPGIVTAMLLLATVAGPTIAGEIAPVRVVDPPGHAVPPVGVYAERTFVVGLEIERDVARLIAYTIKPRPYVAPLEPAAPRPQGPARDLQVEVVLLGDAGARHTRRVDAGPLCVRHPGRAEPHIAGDTIRVHRDSVLVELPEVAGFDRVEVAYYEEERGSLVRRPLATLPLDSGHYTAAGGALGFEDLLIGGRSGAAPRMGLETPAVLWPEDFGDPDVHLDFGDPADADRRINVVIVPDGYTHAEKAVMEADAAHLVAHLRGKTPYAEHDPLIHYTLVYAYSPESGTDQCDCGIVRDTAMGTRFPQVDPRCGHADNRCLYYGGGCDLSGIANIVAAELRAPYRDETVVMVHTTRYGGCGGIRAVYSAAAPAALEIASHELGHTLGGLADEYGHDPGCGVAAGEVNTSTDPVSGAWPEWIADLGAPREGAQYYRLCLYRPFDECAMRNLGQPFCPVCVQQLSLEIFGHARVGPTAPVAAQLPQPSVAAWTDVPVDFSVVTRLPVGDTVTNRLTWTLDEPGHAMPQVVATDTPRLTHAFADPGTYTVEVEVVADANLVKRVKDGANVDRASWVVNVEPLTLPGEVSAPGSAEPLEFLDVTHVAWEDASQAGVFGYHLYRGDLDDLASGVYGACLQANVDGSSTTVPAVPAAGGAWCYLISGVNPVGEGPLGAGSSGVPRPNGFPCR